MSNVSEKENGSKIKNVGGIECYKWGRNETLI